MIGRGGLCSAGHRFDRAASGRRARSPLSDCALLPERGLCNQCPILDARLGTRCLSRVGAGGGWLRRSRGVCDYVCSRESRRGW